MKKEINELLLKIYPKEFYIYPVNADDSLDTDEGIKVLDQCLRENSHFPIIDYVRDNWDIVSIYEKYQSEISQKLLDEGLSQETVDSEVDWVTVNIYIADNDKSDPVKSLLKNTGELVVYYSLGLDIIGWQYGFMCEPRRENSYATDINNLRILLGMKKDNIEISKLEELVKNADSGDVRIYFKAKPEDLYFNKSKQIRFRGNCVLAIYDQINGSGDYIEIEINKSFPFLKDNLFFSKSDKYSIESCLGLTNDWLDHINPPVLLDKELVSSSEFRLSKNAEKKKLEENYKKVFESGKCSFGDMDINRHRNTCYINDIPCGTKCEDCGTFWID